MNLDELYARMEDENMDGMNDALDKIIAEREREKQDDKDATAHRIAAE